MSSTSSPVVESQHQVCVGLREVSSDHEGVVALLMLELRELVPQVGDALTSATDSPTMSSG